MFYVGLLSLFVFFIKGLSAPQETTLDPPADLPTEVCTFWLRGWVCIMGQAAARCTEAFALQPVSLLAGGDFPRSLALYQFAVG